LPKVSVIIPCYNLGEYLDEAVDSVLSQTYKDFEVIIINDGSTDEHTNELLRNYDKDKCSVYHTVNQGLPAARNYGIRKSSGEYICCLDADDKYDPGFLAKTVAILEEDTGYNTGIVTTWVNVFGEEFFIWKTGEFNIPDLLYCNVIHVASLFRKRCWEEVNGYALNLNGYQDWSFWLSIVGKGYFWSLINEPLFYYRKRKNSMVKGSDARRLDLFKTIMSNNIDLYSNHLIPFVEKIKNRERELEELIYKKDELISEQDELISEQDELILDYKDRIRKLESSLYVRIIRSLNRFYKNK